MTKISEIALKFLCDLSDALEDKCYSLCRGLSDEPWSYLVIGSTDSTYELIALAKLNYCQDTREYKIILPNTSNKKELESKVKIAEIFTEINRRFYKESNNA